MVATRPVDFRRGMNGLVALVASALSADPYCGDIFVFRAKRLDRLRFIFWDGSGLRLTHEHGLSVRAISELRVSVIRGQGFH